MKNNAEIEVLYEDNHLIAVNKPAKMLSQGDNTGDDPVGEWVKQYIKIKKDKPGEVFLGLVHRLDRPTSGILLFARTSKALTRINEMLKQKDIEKTYWAIVQKKPTVEKSTLKHYLTRIENKNITKASAKSGKDAKEAILSYEVIAERNGFFLLEVIPETGRQHQIRVQLAAIGCPIVGDVKYGFPTPNEDASICLHARKLEFIHPVSKVKVVIKAKSPNKNAWNKFNMN
jgi:23S rRNA pseudouridine1911/1915/1917 synthase